MRCYFIIIIYTDVVVADLKVYELTDGDNLPIR